MSDGRHRQLGATIQALGSLGALVGLWTAFVVSVQVYIIPAGDPGFENPGMAFRSVLLLHVPLWVLGGSLYALSGYWLRQGRRRGLHLARIGSAAVMAETIVYAAHLAVVAVTPLTSYVEAVHQTDAMTVWALFVLFGLPMFSLVVGLMASLFRRLGSIDPTRLA